MRKLIIATAGVTLLASPSTAEDETVAARQRSFSVVYQNGGKETFVAKYRGAVQNSKWESGGPAKPFEGKFTDDRQCHWDISTQIVRDVCLVSASGQQFCQGQLNRIYGTSFSGKGSDFKLLQLASENCGQADARYKSDLNNARDAVAAAMDGVLENDLKRVRDDLSTMPNVKVVTLL